MFINVELVRNQCGEEYGSFNIRFTKCFNKGKQMMTKDLFSILESIPMQTLSDTVLMHN